MAVLGLDILLQLVEEKKLVKDLAKRELTDAEGTGVDLRAGKLFEFKGPGFLHIDLRDTPRTKEVARFLKSRRNQSRIVIPSGTSYLVQTVETVKMPAHLVALVQGRSTLLRSDVSLETAFVSPGYKGKLTFRIRNDSPSWDFTLEMGARIAHIIFLEIRGQTRLYRGQWRGNRVSTKGQERQV
jgi:dUTP pyrophosphatase